MKTLVETYNHRKKTVTISLQTIEKKVDKSGKTRRKVIHINEETFKQNQTESIEAYKHKLREILKAEQPKHYKERKYA
ncbi:Uncharacterised protein [Neisseria animaloris]|uniref:hypothetical protein n=1 Tax=Neisseria animaloris TaxID=326522 RepID=UPI000A18A8D1|nr:hypothetical protein [Neisseria animaloris]OSI06806.1 hypothetical protein BWD08_10615 [Neisseria animaloris]VEH86538.1 Uncharacterised protein [Neisseria animaloris]